MKPVPNASWASITSTVFPCSVSEADFSATSHSIPAACSRFFPFVSRMNKKQKMVARTSKPMKIKKVFAPTFVIMYGLAMEKQTDVAQWANMDVARPTARMRVGKISGAYAHGRGPHEQL